MMKDTLGHGFLFGRLRGRCAGPGFHLFRLIPRRSRQVRRLWPLPTAGTTLLLSTLLVSLLLTGCRFFSTSISKILENPRRYHDQEVTVEGRVEAVRWMPQLGTIGFRLVSGGDSLLVLSQSDPPAEGERVRLAGRIHRAFPISGGLRTILYYRIDPAVERGHRVDPR